MMDRRRGCQVPAQPLLHSSSIATSSFHDDQEHRCSGKVRMRKWLVSQVSSRRYIGLKWIDKDKTLLRIPWKHGSRSGWSVEDGKLFESWAIQSGKFDPLRPNARRWKANFRCALRSLPDVEEVKTLSHKTGKDAYKIFKFLPEKQRKQNYKSSRSSRQNYSKLTSNPDELRDRPNMAASVRPEIYGKPEAILDRKLPPTEMLHPMMSPYPGARSTDDNRRLCCSLGVPPDARNWTTQPPVGASLCSPTSDAISSVLSSDLGSWSFRNQLPPPPPPFPPNVSAPFGPFSVGPFDEMASCGPHPFGGCSSSSPLAAADPPVEASYYGRSSSSSRPGVLLGSAEPPHSSGGAGGEHSEMTAYEAPYFGDIHYQPEITDVSDLPSFSQWPNATENFMAEVFEVMQQVFRDRCGMANDNPYEDDLEQFEGKMIHPYKLH